jgi:hypothetical protein
MKMILKTDFVSLKSNMYSKESNGMNICTQLWKGLVMFMFIFPEINFPL